MHEIRLLTRGMNNAIQKSCNEIDLAVLTASDIDKVREEVESLIDSIEKCVMAHIEKVMDIGDFSDDIEEWKNELEAVKTVWELCLYKWDDQLEKNKKLLEAEIDAREGDVFDEVSVSLDSLAAGTPAVILDYDVTPSVEDVALPGSTPP